MAKKIILFIAVCLLLINVSFYFLDDKKAEIDVRNIIVNDYVPLYYNIDNPNVVYTKENNEYVEVKLDG